MTFDESVVIDAEPTALFRLSQDYGRRLEWDPFLRSANLVGDARAADVGVRALCVSRSGWAMETEYVSFNPPRATAVKMTSGPWFLDQFAGSWRFEEVAPGRTRVGSATACGHGRSGCPGSSARSSRGSSLGIRAIGWRP
jgi:Polyketide cyclase / dehydrase and lipid transport